MSYYFTNSIDLPYPVSEMQILEQNSNQFGKVVVIKNILLLKHVQVEQRLWMADYLGGSFTFPILGFWFSNLSNDGHKDYKSLLFFLHEVFPV